jgi:hypothetical protein
MGGLLHEPVPRVHDEFSYLLMAETLASGHVSNPSPPLPEFFDTFHVLMRPAYVSKYFPAQGLFLALGQKLTGHPAVGVWLSSALACAATCWMLQAWVGPVWGLLGVVLMVIQIGVFSYWSQTYWGGMVAALGGALFFGAVRRLWKEFSWRNSIWLALGLVILANSRPLEGLLAALPVSCLLLSKVVKHRQYAQIAFWGNLAIPAGTILLLGATASGAYNRAITGSWWKPPYVLHEQQYQESPQLVFLPLRPKLTYSSEWVRYYYEFREMRLYMSQRTPLNLVITAARKLTWWWSFYCGILLSAPLLLVGWVRRGRIRYAQTILLVGFVLTALVYTPRSLGPRIAIDVLALAQIALLWIAFESIWARLALLTCSLLLLEGFFLKFFFAHYFAPAACLVLFLQVEGLRRIWHWRRDINSMPGRVTTRSERRRAANASVSTSRAVFPWRGFVVLLPLLCIVSLGVRIVGRVNGWSEDPRSPDRKALLMNDWSLRRADLDQWLQHQPRQQLVFVRYSPRHDVIFEWVYNHADLIHSQVVWARDLGAEHNQLLLKQMPDRTPWIVYADNRDPQLIPYSDAVTPAGSSSPDTHGAPEEDSQN